MQLLNVIINLCNNNYHIMK